MIQKICSLPPNLLIQGKTGLRPVKGAPSKYSGVSSLGREKFVASTEKKKRKKEKDYPLRSWKQPRKQVQRKVVPKIVRQIPPPR